MVWKVEFSSEANTDFSLIIEYLKNEWTDNQINLFNITLENKIKFITQYPYSYPAIPKNNKIRKCVLNKQISLFYLIKENSVIVLRLFDSRSNPSNLKLQI